MCIPPLDEAPGPHFALTAKIAGRNGLKLLSMGMSADFATAIAFGATHVRVGSAIFGERGKIGLLYSTTILVSGPSRDSSRRNVRELKRDAARRSAQIPSRGVNEHRAAASGDARPGVVVDLDDEIVEIVASRKPVACSVRGKLDGRL